MLVGSLRQFNGPLCDAASTKKKAIKDYSGYYSSQKVSVVDEIDLQRRTLCQSARPGAG
jgi:hypothetical protein